MTARSLSTRLSPTLGRRGRRASAAHRRGGVRIMLASVVAVGVVLAGVAWWFTMMGGEDDGDGPLTHIVKSDSFIHEVIEQGEVESSSNVEVVCEVKGRNGSTAILWVIEEGAKVKEGDLLVKLDSSAFEQELVQQEIICNTSLAIKIQAQNSFDAAEISKLEYVEGTFVNEEQQINSELLVAEETLRKAREYVKFSESLATKGYVTQLALEGDRFAVDKAANDVETAKTKLKVLRTYTYEKFLKQLDSDIASAEAKWKSEESSYALELKKLEEAQFQVDKCEISSPAEGQVVYANKVSSRGGSSEFIVEAGAMVRERQEIIRLPDPTQMQVKAKISESQVTSVTPGMRVTVTIQAFGEGKLTGRVMRVNEYPEPTSFFSSQIKEYATFIRIDHPPEDIRPGLTAEVSIRVEELKDVVQIPVQAILEHGRKTYFIKRESGQWSLNEIELGSSNAKFVVVTSGLSADEEVVLNPRKYADKVELPEIIEEEIDFGPADESPSGGQPSDRSGQLATGGGQRGPGGGGQRRPGGGGEGGGGRPGGGRPGGGGGGGGGNPAAIATSIMGRMDANKDGQISKDELTGDGAGRMAGADTDGDGNISQAELTAAMAKAMQGGGGGQGGRGGPGGGGAPRQRAPGAGE